MAKEYLATAKVYQTADGASSIIDMLAYFEKHGAMRVSDLHIKVGTPRQRRSNGEDARLCTGAWLFYKGWDMGIADGILF